MLDIDMRFLAFELLSVGLFVFYALHAFHRDHQRLPAGWFVGELLGAFLFGLLLEYVGVKVLNGYVYGHFLLSVDGIPLSIAFYWAVIIYTAMSFSDQAGLPVMVRPFADALLVLNIDFAMDAIATRLGMWSWGQPPGLLPWNFQWFGVPYVNFYGWMFVAFSFSMFVHVFRYVVRKQHVQSVWLSVSLPWILAIFSEGMLYAALRLLAMANIARQELFLIVPVVVAVIAVLIGCWKIQSRQKMDWRIAIAPVAILVYFVIMFFTPLPAKSLWLLAVTILMLAMRLAATYWGLKGPQRALTRAAE